MTTKKAMSLLREMQVVSSAKISDAHKEKMLDRIQKELEIELAQPVWLQQPARPPTVSQPGGVPPDPESANQKKK